MPNQTTPTMPVQAIKVGSRHRKQMGDIAALAADIDAVGLLQPIVVDEDGRLIAGERRLEAWKRSSHRREHVPVHVVDLKSIARGEWSENVHRKAFSPSEAVQIARRIAPLLKEEGRRRQGRAGMDRTANAPTGRPINTREMMAAGCGISGRSLDKAIAVVEAAEKNPGRYGPFLARMDETGNISEAFRAIHGRSAARLLSSINSIFATTKIGNVEFGDFTAPELRWLIAFFAEIGAHIGKPFSEDASADEIFKASEISAAVAVADQARKS